MKKRGSGATAEKKTGIFLTLFLEPIHVLYLNAPFTQNRTQGPSDIQPYVW
jgi:hypothetical protein